MKKAVIILCFALVALAFVYSFELLKSGEIWLLSGKDGSEAVLEDVKQNGYDELKALRMRISVLENFFDRSTPEKTAQLYAQSLMKRNGALEYSLYSDKMKKSEYKRLYDLNFISGVSSPWVESYRITDVKKNSDGSYTVKLRLRMQTSAGGFDEDKALSLVQSDGKWSISGVS